MKLITKANDFVKDKYYTIFIHSVKYFKSYGLLVYDGHRVCSIYVRGIDYSSYTAYEKVYERDNINVHYKPSSAFHYSSKIYELTDDECIKHVLPLLV